MPNILTKIVGGAPKVHIGAAANKALQQNKARRVRRAKNRVAKASRKRGRKPVYEKPVDRRMSSWT